MFLPVISVRRLHCKCEFEPLSPSPSRKPWTPTFTGPVELLYFRQVQCPDLTRTHLHPHLVIICLPRLPGVSSPRKQFNYSNLKWSVSSLRILQNVYSPCTKLSTKFCPRTLTNSGVRPSGLLSNNVNRCARYVFDLHPNHRKLSSDRLSINPSTESSPWRTPSSVSLHNWHWRFKGRTHCSIYNYRK